MFNSEDLAFVAKGAMKSEYKFKENWHNHYIENELKNDFNKNSSIKYKSEDINKGKKKVKGIYNEKEFKYVFQIPQEKIKIFNFYLKIKLLNFNQNINEIINLESFIEIIANGNTVSKNKLEAEILLAKIKGKKIICNDKYIILPLILTDLFCKKKFPIYLLKYSPFNINLCGKKLVTDITLIYNYIYKEKYNIDSQKNLLWNILITNQKFYNYLGSFKINESGPTKMLFFNINLPGILKEENLINPEIYEIRLFLNNLKPIIYNELQGDILKLKLFNKTYFGISLSPNYIYKSDIKKIFDEDLISEKSNYGINFSRIVDTRVEFDSNCPLNEALISTIKIGTNSITFSNGIVFIKYVC